jgi:hypothetical protein
MPDVGRRVPSVGPLSGGIGSVMLPAAGRGFEAARGVYSSATLVF